MFSVNNINLSNCTENKAIVLLCTKMYYTHDEINELLRFDTLNYLSNNQDIILKIFFENPNIDNIKNKILNVNKFINNVDINDFSKMFKMNTHSIYINEKFNLMKQHTTYFIVSRDNENLKNFFDLIDDTIKRNDVTQYTEITC